MNTETKNSALEFERDYHKALVYTEKMQKEYPSLSSQPFDEAIRTGKDFLYGLYQCNIPNWRSLNYTGQFFKTLKEFSHIAQLRDIEKIRNAVSVYALQIFCARMEGQIYFNEELNEYVIKSDFYSDWELHQHMMENWGLLNLPKFYQEIVKGPFLTAPNDIEFKYDLLGWLLTNFRFPQIWDTVKAMTALDDIIFCLGFCDTIREVQVKWTKEIAGYYSRFVDSQFKIIKAEPSISENNFDSNDSKFWKDPMAVIQSQRENPGGLAIYDCLESTGYSRQFIGWGQSMNFKIKPRIVCEE